MNQCSNIFLICIITLLATACEQTERVENGEVPDKYSQYTHLWEGEYSGTFMQWYLEPSLPGGKL